MPAITLSVDNVFIILKPTANTNISLKLDNNKDDAVVKINSNKPKKLIIVIICTNVEPTQMVDASNKDTLEPNIIK